MKTEAPVCVGNKEKKTEPNRKEMRTVASHRECEEESPGNIERHIF